MARPIRIEYPGAYYHVTSRGNARERIFDNESDYEAFIEILAESVNKYAVVLISFVLMANHYHLLLKTPHGNLSSFMRHLNGLYTQKYNRAHRRVGHVLQGRYKAILVEDESYFLELIRYIHLNPFWAKIVDDIDGYVFSSHNAIIDNKTAEKWENWYKVDLILEKFGQKQKQAIIAYREFIKDGIDRKLENPVKNAHFGYILGSEDLVKWVQKNFIDKKQDRELRGLREIKSRIEPEDIIRTIAKVMKVEEKQITESKRGRGEKNTVRGMAIYLIQKYTSSKQREIGLLLDGISNVSVSVASKRFKSELQNGRFDCELKKIVNTLNEKT